MPSPGRGTQTAQIAAQIAHQAQIAAQIAHEAEIAAQRAREAERAAEIGREEAQGNPDSTSSGTGGGQGGGTPVETRYGAVEDITRYIEANRPLDLNNPNNPEYYLIDRGDEKTRTCLARFGEWTKMKDLAKKVADFSKGSSNFDVLLSLSEGEKVRATKSLLHNELGLYKLPKNKASRYTWGALKKLWNEGYATGYSDKKNAIKVAERAPRILIEKAEKIFDEFNGKRNDPTRLAAAVLSDIEFEDGDALKTVLQKLQILFKEYKDQMAIFSLDSQSGESSKMDKVKVAIDAMIEENFGQIEDLQAREESKVSELKASLIHYFTEMNKIARLIAEEETRLSSPVGDNPTSYELKEKIHRSVDALFDLAIKNQNEIDALKQSIEHFEIARISVKI